MAARLDAPAEVLACLLTPDCSGLFRSSTAHKSPATRSREYWVDPALPAYIQAVVRDRVMPTLADWTGGAWREVDGAREGVLRWYEEGRYPDGCKGDEPNWAGCSDSGKDIIALSHLHKSGSRYPGEVVWQTALHEAAHALFYAQHTEAGLMCIGTCPRTYTHSEGGSNWPMKIREIDGQVFTLFSSPVIRHGMTPQEVAQLFGAAPPPTATPTPTPTPVPTPMGATPTPTPSLSAAELAAIAAGTRCSGLASLKVLEWTNYPRIDAEGRISMSGFVGPDAPRLKDARRGAGGSIHPLFTFYAQEKNDDTGNFRSVGRIWPADMKDRVSGRGSPNAFAEVYDVTERSFDVVATLPPAILAYDDLRVTAWTERVEQAGATGRTAAAGTCKVWR